MTALIDADIAVYRAIAVMTSEVDWDGEGVTPIHNRRGAEAVADEIIEGWLKRSEEKDLLLVFSDRTKEHSSFRHIVHPKYKGNRTGEKPAMHMHIHDYLIDQYPSKFIRDLEGDDVLGIMATDNPDDIIVSIDKDMLTLPCRLLNPYHPDATPQVVGEFQANYNWMFQTIVGDSVDNFRGAPGAGPAAAQRWLGGCENLGHLVDAARNCFFDQGDSERWSQKFLYPDDPMAEFVMNARCARILRVGDYRPEEHTVRLWHPEPERVEWINPYCEVTDDGNVRTA